MGYAIAGILVVLAIAGFVAFMVLNATKRSGPAATADEGAPGIGSDSTPLGDTREHAGEYGDDGRTIDDPESGTRRGDDRDAAAHRARPGEGEGGERLEFEGESPRPAAGRPAGRDEA
jgi:hypothetical protein